MEQNQWQSNNIQMSMSNSSSTSKELKMKYSLAPKELQNLYKRTEMIEPLLQILESVYSRENSKVINLLGSSIQQVRSLASDIRLAVLNVKEKKSGPFQRIIKSKSEKDTYDSFEKRMDQCIKVLETSLVQSEQMAVQAQKEKANGMKQNYDNRKQQKVNKNYENEQYNNMYEKSLPKIEIEDKNYSINCDVSHMTLNDSLSEQFAFLKVSEKDNQKSEYQTPYSQYKAPMQYGNDDSQLYDEEFLKSQEQILESIKMNNQNKNNSPALSSSQNNSYLNNDSSMYEFDQNDKSQNYSSYLQNQNQKQNQNQNQRQNNNSNNNVNSQTLPLPNSQRNQNRNSMASQNSQTSQYYNNYSQPTQNYYDSPKQQPQQSQQYYNNNYDYNLMNYDIMNSQQQQQQQQQKQNNTYMQLPQIPQVSQQQPMNIGNNMYSQSPNSNSYLQTPNSNYNNTSSPRMEQNRLSYQQSPKMQKQTKYNNNPQQSPQIYQQQTQQSPQIYQQQQTQQSPQIYQQQQTQQSPQIYQQQKQQQKQQNMNNNDLYLGNNSNSMNEVTNNNDASIQQQQQQQVNMAFNQKGLIPPTPYYALSTFTPRQQDELEIRQGDEVIIVQTFDDGWAFGRNSRTQMVGVLPMTFLDHYNNTNTNTNNNNNNNKSEYSSDLPDRASSRRIV